MRRSNKSNRDRDYSATTNEFEKEQFLFLAAESERETNKLKGDFRWTNEMGILSTKISLLEEEADSIFQTNGRNVKRFTIASRRLIRAK